MKGVQYMRYIISLFWGFIFAFVAIFIIKSILGDNGQSLTIQNCLILSAVFSVSCVLFDLVANDKKKINNK